jgi:hypothetical protein
MKLILRQCTSLAAAAAAAAERGSVGAPASALCCCWWVLSEEVPLLVKRLSRGWCKAVSRLTTAGVERLVL